MFICKSIVLLVDVVEVSSIADEQEFKLLQLSLLPKGQETSLQEEASL